MKKYLPFLYKNINDNIMKMNEIDILKKLHLELSQQNTPHFFN